MTSFIRKMWRATIRYEISDLREFGLGRSERRESEGTPGTPGAPGARWIGH
jgi:hypothetical protein